jgi:hypothetical protein
MKKFLLIALSLTASSMAMNSQEADADNEKSSQQSPIALLTAKISTLDSKKTGIHSPVKLGLLPKDAFLNIEEKSKFFTSTYPAYAKNPALKKLLHGLWVLYFLVS